jgi:murein DD-endopeptidase MepM/ murein hydrolase activator NlpD
MVVASPLNLKKVTTSASDSQKKVTEARSSVKNIGQVILKRTKVKRESFAQTNLFRKRREENEKRMMLEDELEAPRVAISLGGPQQLTQSAGVGGFFNRILGFIGYLSAGWLMNNLPTWIAMGKEFVARIQKAGQILSGFFNNTIRLFVNVGNILGALGQNLLQFDFFDTSNRVKTAMSDLNFTMENLTSQIEEAFGLLTTPLTEGKYSGEKIPEVGTQQTNEGAYAEPPPYSGGTVTSGGGTKYPELASLVVKGEGGLNSVNRGNAGDTPGGAKSIFGKNLTDMTVGEIMQAQKENRVFAVGKYQFIPVTLAGAVRHTKIPLNAKFNSATQNRLFDYLIDVKRPEIGAYINGKSNNRRLAIQQLAREFASVGLEYPEAGRVRGQSRYAGVGRNRASISPETAGDALDMQRKGGPAQTSQQSTQAVSSRGITPIITSRYGELRGTRTHGGSDLAVKQGTSLRAVSDGVIVDSDYENGWGNFLVMRDNLGIYHLYGHMQSGYKRSGPVKKGEVIGKVGMSGRTSGPHLHWETGTGWNGGTLTGKFDPLNKYSKFAPFNTTSEVQMSAPPQQTNMVPLSLTPERKGQDIMIIEPQQQQNIITPASGGGDMSPSPISDFQLLNNFIKNKLLLDLAYV